MHPTWAAILPLIPFILPGGAAVCATRMEPTAHCGGIYSNGRRAASTGGVPKKEGPMRAPLQACVLLLVSRSIRDTGAIVCDRRILVDMPAHAVGQFRA